MAVHDDLAYSLWAEQLLSPQVISDDEIVLILRPSKTVLLATTLVVTCENIQMQTSPKPTTLDPSGKLLDLLSWPDRQQRRMNSHWNI